MELHEKKLIEWLNKNKLLLLICFIGLSLRLLGLINIKLAGDNVVHWQVAGSIVKEGVFPLLGPSASVNDKFHLGPFYFYLLAIPYLLGQGNFRIAVIFFSLLNTISIFILYLVSTRWFSTRQSLQITALYAFSAYIVSIQNFPWNPYVLPFFIIFSLYLIVKIREGKCFYFPLLCMFFSACLQIHATAVFLLPVFIYLLPIRKIAFKYYVFGLLIFLISISPWLYADLISNFSQTRAALTIFQQGKSQDCSFAAWIVYHGHGEYCFSYFRNTLFAFRLITMSLFNTQNIIFVFLTIFAIALYFWKEKMFRKKLALIWLISQLFLFLFYSSNIYLHYFLILIPIPFFIFVGLLSMLDKIGKRKYFLSNFIFLLILIINIMQYLYSLRFSRG